MFNRLYNFLKRFSILYKNQFGFRKNYSTKLALVEILEKINLALDNQEIIYGLYLDLSKAFDTVNHEYLITKLDHYGIRGIALKWFQSYLTNRKQFVQINENKSELN